VDFVANCPALDNYTPVAGISKRDFAKVLTAAGGIAGVLGTSALITNIFMEIPSDHVVNTKKSNEILNTILEACRLRAPVNNINFRTAESMTTSVNGTTVTIKKDTLCAANLHLAMTDPKQFSNPRTFDSTRPNLVRDSLNFNHAGWSAEGSGTRQCPGRNISVRLATDLLKELQKKNQVEAPRL